MFVTKLLTNFQSKQKAAPAAFCFWVEKGLFSRQFFILPEWLLQMGLLISAPGTRFPRGGP
jgi:hypothetical protein